MRDKKKKFREIINLIKWFKPNSKIEQQVLQ